MPEDGQPMHGCKPKGIAQTTSRRAVPATCVRSRILQKLYDKEKLLLTATILWSRKVRVPYSKHKDRSPKDTVGGIVSTLEEVGLSTEVRWTSHPFEGLCSNRVTIAGTNIGTNGKGTSEEYCLASGYAEFMVPAEQHLGEHRP